MSEVGGQRSDRCEKLKNLSESYIASQDKKERAKAREKKVSTV